MEIAALLMLGVVVGALGTLVGVGGGFIIVPVLLAFMPGLGHAQVVAVSLVAVAANGISGSIGYLRQRPMPIAVRPAVVIALATLPGAVAGPLLVRMIDARMFAVGLACVMLLAAMMLMLV
ncbi:MAG: TSUP family transporter, partial [Planctomyces sp.]